MTHVGFDGSHGILETGLFRYFKKLISSFMKAMGKFLDNEAHNTGQFNILSFFATVLFPL